MTETHSMFAVADDAFQAYAAMIRAESAQPELANNSAWVRLRKEAWELFSERLGGLSK